MAFSSTATGATNQSSIVRGNVSFVSGAWIAGAAANGTIAVHATNRIVAAGAYVNEAVEAVQVVWNSNDGTADSSDGDLYLVFADATNNTGHWWAIVENT